MLSKWMFRSKFSGAAVRPARSRRAGLRVEPLEDRTVPATPLVVTTTVDAGPGSLRQAILDANATPGADAITFAIGTGVQTIAPLTQLPTITGTVTIDGTTQPGYAGTPVVVLSGASAGNTANGLVVQAADCTVRGLVVNRFAEDAIRLTGPAATGNVIAGNFIGTDVSGTVAAFNDIGVRMMNGASGNTIGGTAAGDGNLISGNGYGVLLAGAGTAGNVILGNRVGTTADGNSKLPNYAGFSVRPGATDTVIGGTTAAARNVISGNVAAGVGLGGSLRDTVLGNYVGTNAAGTAAVPNGGGISVDDASYAVVAENVISGNSEFGVVLFESAAAGTVSATVRGNFIGTDVSGTAPLGNNNHGIYVYGPVTNTVIGGTTPAERNVISGNGGSGIHAIDPGHSITVTGNYVGTDVTGTKALGNKAIGITANGVIGGPTTVPGTGAGNVVGGNALGITGSGTIQGNLVGLGADGSTVIGNAVGIAAAGLIGGPTAGARNVVAGYTNAGIQPSSGAVVQGNFVGTDISGTVRATPPSNAARGIFLLGSVSNVLVGGSAAGAGNLLAGNGYGGIVIDNSAGGVCENNVLQGNVVGRAGLGNDDGITITGEVRNTLIGGDNPGEGNTVSGNRHGIIVVNSGVRRPDGTVIRGNRIGTTAGGNERYGIRIGEATNTVVGGPAAGQGNVISGNGWAGVAVIGTTVGTAIRGNSISGNGGLGIDLGEDGVTANDTDDADVGANGFQNYPVVAGTTGGPATHVQGTLNSTPDTTFTLDFYANPAGDPEGGRHLGSVTVTTDGSGNAAFDAKQLAATAAGEVVTATATGPDGTSEFGVASPPVAVPLVSLSGRVFDDRDNDGLFNGPDDGLAGAAVTLYDAANAAVATVVTGGDGTYTFTGTFTDGAYRVVAAPVAGLLDGKETAGSLGGTVDNSQDWNEIGVVLHGGDVGTGYDFARIRPSRVQSLVWVDFNNDGEVDFGEKAVAGAAVALTGTDDRGNTIGVTLTTDAQGLVEFLNLRPGTYALAEAQPAGLADGRDTRGTVNGIAVGDAGVNDRFGGLILPAPGSDAVNYNFGERPLAGGSIVYGQTASIGYWHNKNGQNLIKAVNGGPAATQLGNWLAVTFPNMYGASAGPNNLAGKTNAQVAAFYLTLFQRNGQTSPGGPPKLDAQVLATALAVYVTNQTLAGTTAVAYGFHVTADGVGAATYNVGGNGAAFGAANGTAVTVLDLLLAVNARASNGLLYDLDGSGTISEAERALRTQANDVFAAINDLGGL